MIAAVDSYYSYVASQMATVDSTQLMGGLINARDWPQTPIIESAVYLLFMSAVPVDGGSESQVKYEYLCQWVWTLVGADLAPNEQGQNRQSYRQMFKIMSNLRQANFPSFCQKRNYSATSEGVVGSVPVTSVYPVSSIEMVHWTRLQFMPRSDQKSGVGYGAASVRLYAFDDVLSALAS